jgi:hypothetical protein
MKVGSENEGLSMRSSLTFVHVTVHPESLTQLKLHSMGILGMVAMMTFIFELQKFHNIRITLRTSN